ncbi:putative secreted protein [Wickerhamomyces ciferrii]|uniref:Secreted protein n=1 Tax=Wickerhamomyces ciferrii (strain ATCC 14091 / BCRC 22168 / CBS 111 / JCM 3599 / NBRC 0793 / NRRL Y-1031 F-60-10) TaxID=1206466 RepID=K0KQJ8_WICCF|nr:uncharacterized protein BN7_3192 [Wickerhamomyces ciferrii]CCH43639.1 putative secreted protein [Wickerhamomyces ciferrii]
MVVITSWLASTIAFGVATTAVMTNAMSSYADRILNINGIEKLEDEYLDLKFENYQKENRLLELKEQTRLLEQKLTSKIFHKLREQALYDKFHKNSSYFDLAKQF